MLKEISEDLPVVIVTHNNTVGASIKPDYLIFTKRDIENKTVKFNRYFGYPSDKVLTSREGYTMNNIDILLDCLEAGEEAYVEREENYETLKNI